MPVEFADATIHHGPLLQSLDLTKLVKASCVAEQQTPAHRVSGREVPVA